MRKCDSLPWNRESRGADRLAQAPSSKYHFEVRQHGDCLMNASIISALAALAGAAIGGFTSILATWLSQKSQARAQWLAQDKIRRQDLYKEFVEVATKCYADALQHQKADLPALAELYAKINRMRVLSSPRVVARAEQIGQKINDTYLEPSKTFLELREMVDSKTIDIFSDFSEACREEIESLRVQQF